MPREMLILILLAVVALMVIVLRLEREQRRQRETVRQVRESKLYAHVYPLLRKYAHESIEQVMLDRSGLYIRLFYPAGRMLTYRFEMHGLHPIPDDRLYPLAQALGVDLKDLSNPRKYAFNVCERVHANGEREPYYEYNITTPYKDDLQRRLYTKKGA